MMTGEGRHVLACPHWEFHFLPSNCLNQTRVSLLLDQQAQLPVLAEVEKLNAAESEEEKNIPSNFF